MEIKHQETSRINLQAEGPNLRNKVFKHRDIVLCHGYLKGVIIGHVAIKVRKESSQGKYARKVRKREK